MKILYILGSFFPAQQGGPNNTVYWAASELAKQDIDVSVVSLKDGLTSDHRQKYNIKFGKATKFAGLRVYFFSYFLNRYCSISMYIWLFRNIKSFDGIMLTSVFFPITWYAALLCRLFQVPFSIAPRGELEPGALVFRKRLKRALLHLFIKRLTKHAKFFIVTSLQEKQHVDVFFPEQIEKKIIPNFMVMPRYELSEMIAQVQNRSGFLYLGRLHPKKGIENLIEAFRDPRISQLNLTIAGSGEVEYENQLKKSIIAKNLTNQIKFCGHVEGHEKAQLFKSSKALILPSYSENFGNVVLEALSYGLPVIASTNTPWKEIELEKCGYWVSNSPKTLAETIHKLNTVSSRKYDNMCIKSYHFSRREYDVGSKGKLLRSIILDLVS